MNQTYKNNTLLIIIILINILAISAYVYLFQSVKQANQRNSLISSEIKNYSENKDRIISLRNIIKSTEEERDNLNSHFIDKNKINHLLDLIEKIGEDSKTNLEINSVNLSPKSSDKNKNILKIDFKASGSFQNISKLLLLLENAPLEFDFEKVYFNKTENERKEESEDIFDLWNSSFTINLISFL
ncbi:hypothetical protein A2995_01805 [Candidatus Nomurabacteria bacterium RIFCSPLOWO2_01_FULL_33_24]|uniref:Uncharacterized protein n=1 Tax=Candidatus Nomurabacteria bacterium RIFCSPLOWO2_01_FULL_33_24 TaxID=1801765 RepID=A0A1F6X1W3_9BACT|nr:MAG: hypothetical protein A2995_01805 [Candidatus Nomurabacteria bacterium RIFCSPLOWO2_01_FULL_33_24]